MINMYQEEINADRAAAIIDILLNREELLVRFRKKVPLSPRDLRRYDELLLQTLKRDYGLAEVPILWHEFEPFTSLERLSSSYFDSPISYEASFSAEGKNGKHIIQLGTTGLCAFNKILLGGMIHYCVVHMERQKSSKYYLFEVAALDGLNSEVREAGEYAVTQVKAYLEDLVDAVKCQN